MNAQQLAQVMAAAVAAVLNSNGGQLANAATDPVSIIEAKVGPLQRYGGRVQPFSIGGGDGRRGHKAELLSRWPTHDCFGRPFPSLNDLAALPGKQDILKHLTSTGFPSMKAAGVQFFMRPESGVSLLKDQGKDVSIEPWSWRASNGFGGARGYYAASQLDQVLRNMGMSDEAIKAALIADGLLAIEHPATKAPAKRKARVKAQG